VREPGRDRNDIRGGELTRPDGSITLSSVIAHRIADGGRAGTREWVREFPLFKPEELFALVSDVESYPIFLPGCLNARIMERSGRVLRVENVFGFGPMRTRFVSVAELAPPHRLDISSRDGPWRNFRLCWRFQPMNGGCRVSCTSSLELRSALLAPLAKLSENAIGNRLMAAFEARAEALFGRNRRRR